MSFAQILSGLMEGRGITRYQLARELEVHPTTITNWLDGGKRPHKATQGRLAQVLGVTIEYLFAEGEQVDTRRFMICPDCETGFLPDDASEVRFHRERHAAWETALEKFGPYWDGKTREELKALARHKINSEELSVEEYIEQQEVIFKALFSRSLSASNFSAEHVTFPIYVSVLLRQDHWKGTIRQDVYDELVFRYGSNDGIPSGTHYIIAPAPQHKKRGTKKDPAAAIGEVYPEKYRRFNELLDLVSPEVREHVLRSLEASATPPPKGE